MGGIVDFLRGIVHTVGKDANDRAMLERFGPNWREDIDFQRASRVSGLRAAETNQARDRLTLADQLSNLIGTASMGEAARAGEIQRSVDPMVMGGEDGGRGYAVNVPMRETVTPDPADVVPDDLGELTGFDREALVRLGLGKAAQSKRALAELKGDQTLAQIDARNAGSVARDARNNAFRQSLEEFKQKGRGDIAEQTARLRRGLEEYRQGQMNGRFQQGLDSSEARFYDRLDQSQRQWEQSQDLREMSARRQVLAAQLDREAGLTPEGRAQVVFELGIINGQLSRLLGRPADGVTVPQAQPGTPGPRNGASSNVPNAPAEVPPWVAAIVQKGSAATPEERARVATWRATLGR